MLYIGIDISKNKHDLAVIDTLGEIIISQFTFENSPLGFDSLKQLIEHIKETYQDDCRISLEDTGHYSHNLLNFLQQSNYETFTYNPLIIKEFARSLSLRKTKTDKKDALVIARKLRDDTKKFSKSISHEIQEIKFLTRHQSRLIHNRSKAKSLLVRALDLVFPELSKIVNNVHSKYIYELLRQYPSAESIYHAPIESLLKIKYLSLEKIEHIQESTQLSIGTSSYALSLELRQLLFTLEHYSQQIDEIDKLIKKFMDQIHSPILSITGIGIRLGAIILSEIRDIKNFNTPAQLQAFAGLEPAIYQSGQINSKGKMVKRGSPYLRYALMQAARLISIFSPHFKEYLKLKRAQGKSYYVALSHVAKKLIRIIFYLLKHNCLFDESQLS